jgi:hypothetical protein
MVKRLTTSLCFACRIEGLAESGPSLGLQQYGLVQATSRNTMRTVPDQTFQAVQ